MNYIEYIVKTDPCDLKFSILLINRIRNSKRIFYFFVSREILILIIVFPEKF